MIIPPAYAIAAVPVFASLTLITGVALTRPASLLEKIAKIDHSFNTRLYPFVEHQSLAAWNDEDLWKAIDGFRGLGHMLMQARLLSGILFEIRKGSPGEFLDEKRRVHSAVRHLNWELLKCAGEATIRCLRPGLPRQHAHACAKFYCHIAADLGVVFDICDYPSPANIS